jgi:hypothetical protein
LRWAQNFFWPDVLGYGEAASVDGLVIHHRGDYSFGAQILSLVGRPPATFEIESSAVSGKRVSTPLTRRRRKPVIHGQIKSAQVADSK